jgi:hypothetical protein
LFSPRIDTRSLFLSLTLTLHRDRVCTRPRTLFPRSTVTHMSNNVMLIRVETTSRLCQPSHALLTRHRATLATFFCEQLYIDCRWVRRVSSDESVTHTHCTADRSRLCLECRGHWKSPWRTSVQRRRSSMAAECRLKVRLAVCVPALLPHALYVCVS